MLITLFCGCNNLCTVSGFSLFATPREHGLLASSACLLRGLSLFYISMCCIYHYIVMLSKVFFISKF